ncbi:MAG: hypothetical protein WCJ30_10425 [Deltaproteobacteria bacterium]
MSEMRLIQELQKLNGSGSFDTTDGLANALRVCAAGSDSPASVNFFNNTAGTLYGVLVQYGGGGAPVDGSPVVAAVKLLAGESKSIDYPCRSDGWTLGCWAVLSSTPGSVTIAASNAGIITRVNFPT